MEKDLVSAEVKVQEKRLIQLQQEVMVVLVMAKHGRLAIIVEGMVVFANLLLVEVVAKQLLVGQPLLLRRWMKCRILLTTQRQILVVPS